jgi:hypothetical protein
MPGEKTEIAWSVVTHEDRPHTVDWYWGLGILSLIGAAASIFFGNILLALIIALGAGSIALLVVRGPREHLVKIDDRGLLIDGSRYKFSSIASFWVEHDTDMPRLFLTMRGMLMPHYSLHLDSEETGDEVRAHLKRYIDEEEQGPHIGEYIAEMFGV